MNSTILENIQELLNVDLLEATKIYEKALAGGEFATHDDANDWFEKRFSPNIVWIDEAGYTEMCINALKIVTQVAATDYGSSRQRDLGQLWGDMTRGYLAEFAFTQFLRQRWEIESKLDHEQGELDTYLPLDIHSIKTPQDQDFRPPNLNISVKGTKWNGIWLDIPGAQFHHSDLHVLVKVGVSRDHLFAYFKHISVFKDKILPKGVESGNLKHSEADSLFDSLPDFKPIPAYISGFADTKLTYETLPYTGRKGRKNYKITGWYGEIRAGDLDEIKEHEAPNGKVEFEGIGQFQHKGGYLFNVGALEWEQDIWRRVIERL